MKKKFDTANLQIITIHSPEFNYEKDRPLLKKKILEFDLDYPVVIDNDMSYWHRIGNRFWPSFYLIDRKGKLRFVYMGETHKYFAQARRIERDIQLLLDE